MIGALFGLGFGLGNIGLDGRTPVPAALAWGRHWGDGGVQTLLWIGVAFTAIAWLLRLAGTAYLRGDVVFAANVQRDRLIVAGIFRYMRNPLYLGNDALAIGIGLYAPPLGFAIIVLGNAIFGVMLANEEAQQLGRQYGAEYTAYRKAVPAFVSAAHAGIVCKRRHDSTGCSEGVRRGIVHARAVPRARSDRGLR